MRTSLQFRLRWGITLLACAVCFLAWSASAAGITAEALADIGVGDAFTVPILLDTEGESINAIEGTLTYPFDTLTLREIRDGNTMISFWVERPVGEIPGEIRFAGVIPGGYQGPSGEIMTLVFEARESGAVRLGFNDGKAYLNDGTGQSSPMPLRAFAFDIGKSGSGAEIELLAETDKTAPGIFTPVVSSDLALLEGKWFVAFATQDKESGIDRYEIAERRGFRFPLFQTLDWRSATSPSILSDQSEGSYIYVKAIDRAGNSTIARLSPAHPPFYFSDTALVAILLVLIGIGLFYVRRRKFHV